MQSFGLTLVYLGFGGLLTLSLTAGASEAPRTGLSAISGKIGAALAFVGTYSYSIYLWHVPVEIFGLRAIRAMSPVVLNPALLTYIYVAISIPLGILMAHIIEFPALKLRDRLFPRNSGLVTPDHAETLELAEQDLTEVALT